MPAVEKGIQDARTRGYLAGYPMVDFRVTVFDGSYHDVDSNELSFKLAGSLAFKDAMTRARPTILEPIMNVEVYAPSDFAGDLMGDLNGRRGRIGGMDTRGATTIIKAQVPMSEMLTYEQHLTSATGGRGSYHMEYSHYDEVPSHLQTKIIAAAKAERAGVEVEEVLTDHALQRSQRLAIAEWPARSCAARPPIRHAAAPSSERQPARGPIGRRAARGRWPCRRLLRRAARHRRQRATARSPSRLTNRSTAVGIGCPRRGDDRAPIGGTTEVRESRDRRRCSASPSDASDRRSARAGCRDRRRARPRRMRRASRRERWRHVRPSTPVIRRRRHRRARPWRNAIAHAAAVPQAEPSALARLRSTVGTVPSADGRRG